jgi:hypothetical protein
MKGCYVNWAKVVALIAKEKVHRLVIQKFTSGRSSNMSRLNLMYVSCKTKPNDVLCKSYGLLEGTRGKATCPYDVPLAELTQMQDL